MKTILTSALFVCLTAAPVRAQSGDEFVSLFDGTLSGWTVENGPAENFTVASGVLHVRGSEGWLRSEGRYSDFVLRAEFRFLADDTDSGIYVRAVADSEFIRGWPNNSYQVQVRNPIGESRFGPVGDLFRHGTPQGDFEFDPAAAGQASTGTGEWQTLEIEASGDMLRVSLNGTHLSTAGNIINPAGYIGIQSELGAIEFRSIRILER
jgi:hypothetical protein